MTTLAQILTALCCVFVLTKAQLECPADWSLVDVSGSCIRVYQSGATWDDARAACQAEGGDLVKIDSQQANDAITQILQETSVFEAWIGLNDIDNELTYVWSVDDTEVDYDNWAYNEPSNSDYQNCVSIEWGGSWSDYYCEETYATMGHICEIIPLPEPTVQCPTDWNPIDASGSCIRIFQNGADWYGARAACQAEGGDLVKIASQEANDAITEIIQGTDVFESWIGLNDIDNELTYVWSVDNTEVDYNNWRDNEPSDEETQDCALIEWDGIWNDYYCDETYAAMGHICEIMPVPEPAAVECPADWSAIDASGSCIRIFQSGADWYGARAACQAEGGELVKIDSQEANDAITQIIQGTDVFEAWIGVNDVDNELTYVWSVDDTEVDYDNWADGEPESSDVQDCALIEWAGVWLVYYCDETYAAMGHICEIIPEPVVIG